MATPGQDELLPLKLAAMFLAIGFLGYLALELLLFWPSSFAVFWGEIWGRTVLVDLYLTLGVVCAWIFFREERPHQRLGWSLFVLCLGSAGVLGYILKALLPLRRWSEMDLFFLGARSRKR